MASITLDSIRGRESSNRNLIINGAMQVAQRGTSFSLAHDGTTSGFGADRFKLAMGNADEFDGTLSQDSTGPDGFANSMKWATGTGESAIAADEQVYVEYNIEAQDCQLLQWGSANAKPITLSFYVKSSQTGTFSVSMYVGDSSRNIGSTYTILSADTWERKTITFDGDAGGSINDDNGSGIAIYFCLASGSNFTTTDNTSWDSNAAGRTYYGHTQNGVVTTGSATWHITGVQLEPGITATPFEHRSYGDELARCQRYYYRIGDSGGGFYATGYIDDADDTYFGLSLPCSMRIDAPTISYADVVIHTSAGTETSYTINNFKASGASLYLNFDSTSTPWSTGQASSLFVTATTGFLAADAEL